MTTIKNEEFPVEFPHFEIPRTSGQMLHNLFDASMAGVFLKEENCKSHYVKDLLGSTRTKVFTYGGFSTYGFYNFKMSEDDAHYIMGIDLDYNKEKNTLIVKADISEIKITKDALFENFIKDSKLKWVEHRGYMSIEAMAIRARVTHPYGFKCFEAFFEDKNVLQRITLSTSETGFIKNAVIEMSGILS